MKKKIVYLLIVVFTTGLSINSVATTKDIGRIEATSTATKDKAEAQSLLRRLNEINELDKSKLKREDKKKLRKEVKSIKERLSVIGGGVYISVGALILIIILLIILV